MKNMKCENNLVNNFKLQQVRFIRQHKFIMGIDIDMTNSMRNQHREDIAVNVIQQWEKECLANKNGSKKSETLNANKVLTTDMKQNQNDIKIWNLIQENLTKYREIFVSCAKEKVRKKLIETLDLPQMISI